MESGERTFYRGEMRGLKRGAGKLERGVKGARYSRIDKRRL